MLTNAKSDMSAAALEIMGTTHDEFAPKVSSLHRFDSPMRSPRPRSGWPRTARRTFTASVCQLMEDSCPSGRIPVYISGGVFFSVYKVPTVDINEQR